MTRTTFALRAALVAVLSIAPTVSGQAPTTQPSRPTVPTISGPAGLYFSAVNLAAPGPVTLGGTWSGPEGVTITLPAGCTVVQTATSITITWGPAPTQTTAAPAPASVAPASVFHALTR